MKNVKEGQKKKCIFVEGERFKELMKGYDINVTFSFEGIIFEKCHDDEECVKEEDVLDILRKHFDVAEVTSVHIDDCNFEVGVWICYRDEEDVK